jgi:hypothetical protein
MMMALHNNRFLEWWDKYKRRLAHFARIAWFMKQSVRSNLFSSSEIKRLIEENIAGRQTNYRKKR